MLGAYRSGEKEARMNVLDDLIKYMRRKELQEEAPEDALGEGMEAIADKMESEDGEETEREEKPEAILEIENEPTHELNPDEEEDLAEMEDELSPFQKKMKDYFNNRDRPKMGKSMSFMVATKTPTSSKQVMKPSEKKFVKK